MSTTVGESRRSQLVGTFGVGSMFPAPDQSLMICGLEKWPVGDHQTISEQRLAQSLGVQRLIAPRAGSNGDVPVVRFPRFYFCPECRRLGPWMDFDTTSKKKNPRCLACERDAVPSRFVVACTQGHIDDFPYSLWVHAQDPVADGHWRQHKLKLTTKGETSSLADVQITCGCGASRSMEGSFSPKALLGISACSGKRPWLPGSGRENCGETPRVVQRGSSSVWFANIRSAISIPPWSDIHHKIQGSWSMLKDADESLLRGLFALPGWIPPGSHWTIDDLITAVKDLRDGPAQDDEGLKRQEYSALLSGHAENSPTDQFVCTPVRTTGTAIHPFVSEARDVSRLREVTALVSFSRLAPPDSQGALSAKLSVDPVDWLPAIEVFGEGLFVRLDEGRLAQWEESAFAKERSASIAKHAAPGVMVTPRRLLVHTFAHAFMNELSMDAGYPVASLRERIYAGKGQAGILVYTATADSAGSLGGLSAQSDATRLDAVIRSAMRRAQWCSADPVCIESQGSGIDNLNLAACHACMLVPETSCENRNCYLDRTLLIGTPHDPDVGYFSELVTM